MDGRVGVSAIYEDREVTVRRETHVGTRCDGCGKVARYSPEFITVVISVHEGEEGGARDEYDYCDDCLVARAPLLAAAGSRADLVTPEDADNDDGPCDCCRRGEFSVFIGQDGTRHSDAEYCAECSHTLAEHGL